MSSVIFEQITLSDLDVLLKKQKTTPHNLGSNKLVGFRHIFDDTAEMRLYLYQTSYSRFSDLQFYEQQAEVREYDSDYDVNFVARKGDELVGVLAIKWVYDQFGDENLWNYRNRIISVKENFKNKGVATNLLHLLESCTDIQGKVLRFGNFQEEGGLYLRHVIPKVFTNNNYIVVPKNDWSFNKPLPKEFGCYLHGEYD